MVASVQMRNIVRKRWVGRILSVLVAIPVLLVLALFFYPRPYDETPAWVFEDDAASLDYCALPVLDLSLIHI